MTSLLIRLRTTVIVLISYACAASGACADAAPRAGALTILTEHSPPGSMIENGKVRGFATDKVREILRRAHVTYTLDLVPWKRAYTAALEHPSTCVYSTSRTPEREALFKWVGPTDQGDWVLMGRAGDAPVLRSLDDARGMRIGTYYGDARDEYLRARGFQVDPVPNDMLNPPKLLARRIDLWAAGMRRGSNVLERNGWAGKIVPVFTFKQISVYLACNPAVPDALIARMNEAAAAIERDGSARRIEQHYETQTDVPAGRAAPSTRGNDRNTPP